jgi:hypothetical protein
MVTPLNFKIIPDKFYVVKIRPEVKISLQNNNDNNNNNNNNNNNSNNNKHIIHIT